MLIPGFLVILLWVIKIFEASFQLSLAGYGLLPQTLTDPMLATGQSMVASYKALLVHGKPSHTHFVSVVASVQGVEYLKRMLPKTGTTIWVAAIDDELTAQGYIVPGLGDAGDLAFGLKV